MAGQEETSIERKYKTPQRVEVRRAEDPKVPDVGKCSRYYTQVLRRVSERDYLGTILDLKL
ncbi:MAG: hypothetical protein ACTSX6_03875 [Candidatus Heimdallarchaeaceae archaeon]